MEIQLAQTYLQYPVAETTGFMKETLAKEHPPISAHYDPCLPKYITKHTYRDFLTCVVPVDGEKGVGGGCMKWGRLSACKEVVDGDLCGPREL